MRIVASVNVYNFLVAVPLTTLTRTQGTDEETGEGSALARWQSTENNCPSAQSEGAFFRKDTLTSNGCGVLQRISCSRSRTFASRFANVTSSDDRSAAVRARARTMIRFPGS